MARPYKVVVLPDVHLPDIHPSLMAAMKYLAATKAHEVILLGDFIDFPSISHWLKTKTLLREGLRLTEEYKIAGKVLDELKPLTKKITYLYGNHEDWVSQYIQENPELSGIVDIDVQLKLRDRKIQWHEYGLAYSVGFARFIHGFFTIIHHAKKHAEEIGNCYYGHTHDVQVYSKKRHFEEAEEAHSLGCLCGKNPTFMRNKPNRWKNAFGIFYIGDDGHYTRYVPIIINGKFYGPDGSSYSA